MVPVIEGSVSPFGDLGVMRNPFFLVALGIGLLVGLVLLLNALFPGALAQNDAGPSLAHKIGLLALLISSVLVGGRVNLSEALRYGMIWVAIGIVLVLGYSMRYDFQALGERLFGALVPSAAREIEPGAVALTRSANGHFMARATVTAPDFGDATVTFLVDTGASRVSLTGADARRLGLDLSRLSFDQMISTANGTNRAASVRLPRIAIGSVSVVDVRALVVLEGLDVSLLGNSFLDGLSAVEISGDRLILRR